MGEVGVWDRVLAQPPAGWLRVPPAQHGLGGSLLAHLDATTLSRPTTQPGSWEQRT